jgi:hypothetical protein
VPQSFERLAPYVGRALGLSDEELATACRPARESEIGGILALRRSVLTGVWWDDERFVKWRYFPGPIPGGETPFWVFVKGGEILGACGVEPVTLVVDGTAMTAVRTLDIMVRPDLDGLGLGALMNLVLFRRFPITLVTGSNERSHSLLTRMFHHATDLRFWKLPLRARAVIDAKFQLGPFNAIAALPVDAALGIGRIMSRPRVPKGVVIREMKAFDEQLEALSRRCEMVTRVMVRRNDSYLNWRFVQNPRCRYRLFGAFVGNRLEGYVVTRLNRARPNPRREAEIVDWLVAPQFENADALLAALFYAGVGQLRQEGAGIVSCAVATGSTVAPIESIRFRLRPAERMPFFVRAADSTLHARLSVGQDWFVTRGDFDVE